jgi:hypothetical protein
MASRIARMLIVVTISIRLKPELLRAAQARKAERAEPPRGRLSEVTFRSRPADPAPEGVATDGPERLTSGTGL